ncbi:MAG: alanine racemase [Terriglobia bacterium]
MKISELSTPVALVEVDVMARNLTRAVATCRTAGVRYRPHIKTHKMPALAARQIKAGAAGITCAKIGEAEVMAQAGLTNIFVAYPIVGRRRFERLAALAEKVHLCVGVDCAETAGALAEFFRAHNRILDVLLEIDTGHQRCGVPPEKAEDLAAHLAGLGGIRLRGLFTHEGHVYSSGPVEERLAQARQAGEQMTTVAQRLRSRDFGVEVVSVGSSPAQDAACRVAGVTENRPGTNIFNDCTQVHLGACGWDDCALSYSCTVVSRPAPDRAVIDGGTKTFTSDKLGDPTYFGAVQGYPGARFLRASEEHGILTLEDAAARRLRVGERIRVIPSHVCGSINLHDRAYGVQGEEVVEEWAIAARGCVD